MPPSMKLIALALACALSLVLGSCSRPSAAIGNWELDKAATESNLQENPESRRKIYPRIDLLSLSLDVEENGTFTVMSELAGSKSKDAGTWTESGGKIKMMVDTTQTYTATVDGRRMLLFNERMRTDNWVFTLVLNKK